ncbi:Kelch-like protein 20 [Geodia barretti]|uniref:Kelch-like protein 20 n=1 Tax=Geodia barretti TaxID=519541 RepID=A0AA35TJR0_GEOBA|nr:Kelch-like protein 20 [Geodia barretti]
MSVKSYQQLTRLPPPPPSPRTKPALMKTLSAPQAALSRLLGSGGSRGAPEDGRGGGEGDGGGGRASGKRRSKKKRPIEVGEDVLASETPPSASPPLPAAIPEGNLIDLDTDDASSTSESSPSATSLSSYPPSFRSCSVGNGDRPSPQSRRRPPPPPPQRTRLATVSGALSTEKSSPGVKHRPTPPPKPSYLSSPPAEQEHAPTSVPVSDTDGVKAAVTKPEAKPRSSAAQVPSPYITFTPLRSKPEPPPRIRQDSPTSPDSTTSLNSSPTKSTAPVPSSPEENTTPPASSTTVPTHPLHPVTFPNPPPREMEYTEREHSRNVFEYLNKMRRRGDLCDVTLMSSTREIRAHKAVLAACSQYFESMFIGEFAEPDGEPIIVEEIEDDALEALVDFAYTSRIKTHRPEYLPHICRGRSPPVFRRPRSLLQVLQTADEQVQLHTYLAVWGRTQLH